MELFGWYKDEMTAACIMYYTFMATQSYIITYMAPYVFDEWPFFFLITTTSRPKAVENKTLTSSL